VHRLFRRRQHERFVLARPVEVREVRRQPCPPRVERLDDGAWVRQNDEMGSGWSGTAACFPYALDGKIWENLGAYVSQKGGPKV
jgi:hypothetical protein